MHILVIASFYPSAVRPQTGIFFKAQVQALRKSGHQVGVIVAPRLWETLGHIRQHKRWDALTREDNAIYRMHRGWFPRIFPLICAGWHGYEGLKAFEQYIAEQGEPDIIHAHNIFYAGYMATHIAKKHNIPTVLTEHSTNFIVGRIFLPGQHWVVNQTLGQIDVAYAVGQKLANILTTNFRVETPVKTINNVVDTSMFQPLSLEKNDSFIFAAAGYLIRRKRFDLLITAFAKAFKGQPVKLRIGGDGQELDSLRDLIQKLAIENQVDLLGHLSHEQVLDLFQQADVVVSASDVETFGVTLIEAMSCGKPVIATRSGGPEDFVIEDVGLLVPRDDADALSQAMIALYQNYDDYDTTRIRGYCIEMFSEESIVQQLETIYLGLLEN